MSFDNDESTAAVQIADEDEANSSTAAIQPTEPAAAPKTVSSFILEIAVFFFFFAINLSSSVTTNQMLYQTCIVVFQYNESTCEPLIGVSEKTPASESIEDEVQIYVSNIILANSLIKAIIPAILSLFIGPWSDRFGRRPVVLVLAVAFVCDGIILSTISLVSAARNDVSPWLYLLGSIPSVLCGGRCALVTIVYAYVADRTEGRARGMRMLIVQAYLGLGTIIGSLVSGFILKGTSFGVVFCIALVIMIITAIYCYFFVVESLPPNLLQTGSRIKTFFNFVLVMDFIRTSVKKRPDYKRAIIWLAIVYMFIARFVTDGESNVLYLFTTKQFNWTLNNYNVFNTVNSVVLVAGGVIGVIVMRQIFNSPIILLIMIAFAGAAMESLVRAVATHTWEMYLGVVLGLMSGIVTSMSLTILSAATPTEETAKVFGLTTALETLAPLGGAPLYTAIYTATLSTYPGVYNFLSMGLYIVCLGLSTTIFSIEKYRLGITPF